MFEEGERYRLIVTFTDYGLEQETKRWEYWKRHAKPTQKGYDTPPERVFIVSSHNTLPAAKGKRTRMLGWQNPNKPPEYESIEIQRGVIQWRNVV
ncbi:hypothetical protein QEH42_gp060 [Microbacterium phage Pumpernickel]|uniref:Uncharacterized protein n=1 Tax=Microbacterium phage Pumpernickel TaxID=2885983 RepID=A0AAE9C3D3_9CAUD|nr:hypothetical protein QEH42_gp060 [Microbacterium phage Pumpernickel]UDL15851.1 hypothetical protein SEA_PUMPERNICKEL_60 [Microbacterium phage Pumpernickel]